MPPQPKPFCLVVESELGMRNLLDDILSVSGIEVIALASESEAMKFLRSEEGRKVGVVLCQAPPPGAKHSLVAKIRSNPSTAKLPVLCLSPSGGLQDRASAFEAGASEYILRPVSPIHLPEEVRRWAQREHQPF